MVAPLILKIVAFSLAKKVVVFLVAKLYGFPRLYRRASKLNHYLNSANPKRREKFQNRLQFLFRLPTHIYQSVQRWRGVPAPPSAPPGPPHGTTHCQPHQKQVRELHTRASASRVRVPSAPASLRGFGSISQSLRAHLLGWRGAGSQSVRVTRPFSVSCSLLPFGVSSLVSPSLQSHVASSQSDNLRTTPYIGIPSVESRNPVVGLSLICEDLYVLSR